ncbi:MAG: hypothetical protein ABI878_01955 [Acidobacteriota bacterium]
MRSITVNILKSAALVLFSLVYTGCTDDFYLSEKETAAYTSVLTTQSVTTTTFDNLQGRTIDMQFDNSTDSPRLVGSNLLAEMRRTEMAQLETSQSAVDLSRLSGELEKQIDHWIEGRLELYRGAGTEQARLNRLDSVSVLFLNDPAFSYDSQRQTIAFDVSLQITINGEIEVTALDWFLDIFFDINGTYPLTVSMDNLRLQGEVNLQSPFADAGRIEFKLRPQVVGQIRVSDRGISLPQQVRDGVADLLRNNLSSRVDEVFEQSYSWFALPAITLTPGANSHLEVAYRAKADWLGPDAASPLLHIVTRASDGKLYHARRIDDQWTSYSAVVFPTPGPSPSSTPLPRIDNEPALIHSGSNQLELAATDAAGNLVYAHYREDAWGNTNVIKPNTGFNPAISYKGKPAIASSAPGQVEIVVVGSDGQLWHLRRINGAWQIPSRVPQINAPTTAPYRDPVAVNVGNKVVVVYADAANRLRGVDLDLETGVWGAAQLITPSSIKFVPAAVTVSESQVEVAYVKADGTLWRNTLSVSAFNLAAGASGSTISVPVEKPIGGLTPGGSPVLVCSTYKQPELLVPNTSGKLRYNRFVNALGSYAVDGVTVQPGWQGWIDILETNFFTGSIKTDGNALSYSTAGTRTGKTEVIARAKYFTKQHIFFNEYESGRYAKATAPWKTVGWRGWEATGGFNAVGTPAIAAVDRNFQTAHIGNRQGFGPTVHWARLAQTNATFYLGSTVATRTTGPLADPVVLSAGIGMFDTITIAANGKPSHIRNFSDGSGMINTLTTPAGVTLSSLSAFSYGNGLVELVASATNNNVYHWRYRNGTWSAPVLIATGVISAPILIYKGVGQFEMLGVDVDYRLFRSRFLGNMWQPRLLVPGTFRINELAFGPQAAATWGDGVIDIAILNKDTKALNYRRIGPGDEVCSGFGCPAARVFSNLGGSNLETPVMSAFGPTSLNILTMQGLRWYSKASRASTFHIITFPPQPDPAMTWSGFEYIGGEEMVVSGAANTGRKNFAAVGIREGRVLVNRFVDGHWTGFQQVIGQKDEQIILTPTILPAISAMGGV